MQGLGLFIAVVGFCLSVIPIVGYWAYYLLIPAFLLAIIGIILGKERGVACVTICFCFCGLVGVMIWKTAIIDPFKAVRDAEAQVAITGFGGYELGETLNSNELNAEDLTAGYVTRPAKTQFRNFKDVRLYFTPKTFVVYEISSSEHGSDEDMEAIVVSLEEKYKAKMIKLPGTHQIHGKGRTITTERTHTLDEGQNKISVKDNDLEKQNEKEK